MSNPYGVVGVGYDKVTNQVVLLVDFDLFHHLNLHTPLHSQEIPAEGEN